MKIIFVILIACATGLPLASAAERVVVISVKRGKQCNSPASLLVKVKNIGGEIAQVCIYLQKTNGAWNRGYSTLRPNETTSYYTCKSTGKFAVRTKARDDNSPFPKKP